MEDRIGVRSNRPVFKNQPISCPWITCQPYPSSQLIKNKLSEFVKKHGPALNNNSSTKSTGHNAHQTANNQQSSATHFFYFLRLMQLFPDTHPATLHTVLILSKNNFFFAIDKLLYAQKCKSDLTRKLNNNYPVGKSRVCQARPHQRYQNTVRQVPVAELAEVQRIIDLAEKPYIPVPSVETHSETSIDKTQSLNQMMDICVENPRQLAHGTQSFVETENHEVIEIVCFDNDQILNRNKESIDSDTHDMEIETFDGQQIETIEPSIGHELNLEEDIEPPVIIVGTMNDNNDTNEGHLIESHSFEHRQVILAESAQNSEGMSGEGDKLI